MKKVTKKKTVKKTNKKVTNKKVTKKKITKESNKVLLTILDGFGIRKKAIDNAVSQAKMPFYKGALKKYSWIAMNAEGTHVGLPKGQMGTSEVCHMNIGSGRVIKQDLVKINESIKSKKFFKNKTLLKAIKNSKDNNSTLHLIGLCSDGGVHSHINHLFALLELAKKEEINPNKVLIHFIGDGRDTEPRVAKKYVKQIKNKCSELGLGRIATVLGRYYAMDRDNRWIREEKAYDTLVYGAGKKFHDAEEAIDIQYKNCDGDEFIEPCSIILDDYKQGYIKNNDSMIFFNFRSDRARQLTRAFVDPNFKEFKTAKIKIHMTTFNSYDAHLKKYLEVAFIDKKVKNTLAVTLSKKGKTQFHTAETEKYAHVTYFFNAGVEEPYKNESRKLIPSPKVATYDLQPEMSAPLVAKEVIKALDREEDFIVVNFANPDMVGHTGKLFAVKKALEYVDKKLMEIKKKVDEKGYLWLLTADHGNCEEMTGVHMTSHTLNKVPFMILNEGYEIKEVNDPKLADIAPTILKLMNITKPKEMTGRALIKKK